MRIKFFLFIVLIAVFFGNNLSALQAEEALTHTETEPTGTEAEENAPDGSDENQDAATDAGGEVENTNAAVLESIEDTPEDPVLSAEAHINLPNGCDIEDSNGTVHIFPDIISRQYLAICAFEKALEEDVIEDMEFVDFGFGLFVQSINGISEENAYWKLERNGEGASVGAAELELQSGDTVSLVLTEFDPVTFAETPRDDKLMLVIDSLEAAWNNIVLADGCSVTDTAGIVHEFPENGASHEYLAICALQEALEEGMLSDIDFADFGFGLFVDNINNAAKPENSYWQFQINGTSASVGAGEAQIEKGDVVSLVLTAFDPVTFAEEPVEPAQSFEVRIINLETLPDEEEPAGDDAGNGGGNTGENNGENGNTNFSTGDAVSFLKDAQGENGSFGSDELYADWAAIAYGAARVSGEAKTALLEYMASRNEISSHLQDNERRAMALLALGKNPYSFEGVNYIKAILDEFDGEQFGDPDLSNDDMFAIIPLSRAGYGEDDDVITKSIGFIISEQKGNGSWEGSVDVTAAAVQALEPFATLNGVSDALSRAEAYLASMQENDGGWGDVFATSWAVQAEHALGASWTKNGKSGLDYLGALQANADNDGAVLPATEGDDNAIWATSYAIPAGLGKAWNEILKSVSRPKDDDSPQNNEEEDAAAETIDSSEDPEVQIEIPVPALAENLYVPAPIVSELYPDRTAITAPASEKTAQAEEPEPGEENSAEVTPEALVAAPVLVSEASTNIPQIVLGGASVFLVLYGLFKLGIFRF